MDVRALEAPDVSVTLLTLNAGPLLDRLLRAVHEQDTLRHFEIVAVDSGSTDGTPDLLRSHNARVIEIPADVFDFGRARDLVFDAARAPIVVSLSQDAVPAHPHWLENLIEPLDDTKVAVSCGRSIPDPERDYPQFPWEQNGLFYFTREMKKFRALYGKGLSNSNAAYKREVWSKLRFGGQPIGEDYRFQTKLAKTDMRIAFPDDAAVLHHHNYTFKSLYTRCYNEGFGLRLLGCPYSFMDLIRDSMSPRMIRAWYRELFRGRLTSMAALLFPAVRRVAVYCGSRFAREFRR